MRRSILSVPLAAALTLTAFTGAGVAAAAPAVGPDPGLLPAAPVTVSIDARAPGGAVVPADYLGLSIEKRVLATTQVDGRIGNIPALLRGLGAGTLRLGGDSVESTAYLPSAGSSRPSWAQTVVTPADYDRLATLAQASGWKILLGVNLGRYDPQRAADEVATAARILGPSLLAAEVGNEPNAYGQRGLRDPSYGPSDYQAEFAAYRDAINAQSPGVPVVGSSAYPPFTNAFDPGFAVPGTFLTQHLYPLNNCRGDRPTIQTLTSRTTATRQVSELRQGLAVAAAHGIPLRVSETNSVICSGTPGVSNTQGAALWSLDYLMQGALLGVAGVNLHGGLQQCTMANPASTSPWYTPLCAPTPEALAANQFEAQPVYYGMQAFKQLVGSTFIPAAYSTRQNVVIRAARDTTGTVRTVIDDMDLPGSADSLVRLQLPPGYDEALVSRLQAPSVDATTGVTLGGQAVAADGTLAAPVTERVTGRGGVTYVRVSPGSAAVVTLTPRCTVPSVRGLTLVQAKSRLTAAGCRSGIIAKPRALAKGATLVVQKQKLPAGFRYRVDQPVHLQLMVKPVPKKKPAPKPATSAPATPPASPAR